MAAPIPATVPSPSREQQLTLVVVLIGTFLVLLDVGIVNVAVPTIQRSLGATSSQMQLIVAVYQLTYAALLITGGRLGDMYGRKRMFQLGMAAFALTSAGCGFATSPLMLVLARGLQGLAGALLFPQVGSIIQVTFAPHERAAAFGYFGATIGLGTIAGPLLGGLLVAANLYGTSWRPIFLVNVPLALVGISAAHFLLRESRGEGARRLDLIGVALAGLGLGLITVPVVEGGAIGWPWWAWAVLVLGLAVLAGFVRYEARLRERGGAPLLDLTLLNERSYSVGLLLNGVFFLGIGSFFLFAALFLQEGLGFAPLRSSQTLVWFQITAFFVSLISARAAQRLGRGVLNLSAALLTLGMAAIALIIRLRGATLVGWELALPLMACGAGFGLFTGPSQAFILAHVPLRNAGAASGLLATVGQTAAAFGVAIVGALLAALIGGSIDGVERAQFAQAFSSALLFHVVIYALVFGLVLFLPRRPAEIAVSAAAE